MQSKSVRFTALALATAVTLVLLLQSLASLSVESTHVAAAQGEPQPTSTAEVGAFSLFLPHVKRAVDSDSCGIQWKFSENPGAITWSITLGEVAGAASNDVWAVGAANDMSRTLHWDGAAWTETVGPYGSWLGGVIAFATDDVWKVGGSNQGTTAVISHWDGHQWTDYPDALPTVMYSALVDISGVEPHDLWAVGSGLSEHGTVGPLVVHSNGSAWSPVTLPGAVHADAELAGVFARAANDVWIVGGQGDALGQGLILHWDGAQLSSISVPQDTPGLRSVTALAANDAWAVGREATILHWDGTAWSRVALSTDAPRYQLNDILALSRDNIWVVGHVATILHWDGAQWVAVPPPNLGEGERIYKDFTAITAVAANDLWIVGRYHPGPYSHIPYLILHGTSACP